MPTRVVVPAFAKLNLSLEVLEKRADGFHNLRTLFQTISLQDEIEIEYDHDANTTVEDASEVKIDNNLVTRAALLLQQQFGVHGRLRYSLRKGIPMGAGLGGGSSDAAAMLLALPALAGKPVDFQELMEAAAQLGSDIPFFLIGGTAIGLGRGGDLYPVKDIANVPMLLVTPDVHSSTPDAYKALARTADYRPARNFVRDYLLDGDLQLWVNDFENAVYSQYPELRELALRLKHFGAEVVRMTGSGSALFAVFAHPAGPVEAQKQLRGVASHVISAVNRTTYQQKWRRALGDHAGRNWPPAMAR